MAGRRGEVRQAQELCDRLARMGVQEPDSDEARQLCDDVAVLASAADGVRDRASIRTKLAHALREIGWVDRALVEVTRALEDLDAAPEPNRPLRGSCWLLRAEISRSAGRYRDAVDEFDAAVKWLWEWKSGGVDLSGAMAKGIETRLATGEYLAALEECDRYVRKLDECADDYQVKISPRYPEFVANRTALTVCRARALSGRGEFTAALTDLRNLADQSDVPEVTVQRVLAQVCLDCGMRDDAYDHVNHAMDALGGESAADTDLDPQTCLRLADTFFTRSAVQGARSEWQLAVKDLRRARTLYARVPNAEDRLAACRINLAVELLHLEAVGLSPDGEDDADVLAEAATELERALDFFDTRSPNAELNAGCHLNLGRARDRQGRHADAVDEIAIAQKKFEQLGSGLLHARSAIASALTHAGWAESPLGRDEVLDLLLPALLYLDQRRFQFSTVRARSGWKQMVAQSNRRAFELAADNPKLLAQLIENTINSGVHTSDTDDIGVPTSPVTSTDAQAPTLDGLGRSSVGSLLAGTRLPMRPPPEIVMPDGTVALGRYRQLARERFGASSK